MTKLDSPFKGAPPQIPYKAPLRETGLSRRCLIAVFFIIKWDI